MNGGRQICFTDSKGKALFSIPDGGIIRLFYGNGDDYFAIAVIWMKPVQGLTVWITPYGNLHGGWNGTKSVMPLHRSTKETQNKDYER